MKLIQSQRVFSHLILALVVIIGVFAENGSTSVQLDSLDIINSLRVMEDDYNRFENDEDPDFVFYKAASLSKSLALRNHTKISNELDTLMTEDQMKLEIEALYADRVEYVELVLDRSKTSLEKRNQTAKLFTTSNIALMNSIFGRTLEKGENKADQFTARIIRHQLFAPLKIIYSLCSFPLQTETEQQLLSQAIEQLKYKLRLFKEVLHDFDTQLKDTPKVNYIKDAIAKFAKRLNGACIRKYSSSSVRYNKINVQRMKNVGIHYHKCKTTRQYDQPTIESIEKFNEMH